MATVIPKQMYVTIQHRKEGKDEPTRLGFASPYTKDAAFRKRKDSQDSWAYGRGTDFIIKDDDGVFHGPNGTKDVAEYFMTNSFPRVLGNEPLDGFEIARSVRRSGWSGSGNVLWRIQDPRGFELEITSENFASMLDCSTLINGVIQDKCVWGRDGSKNVLLPVSSDPYKEATKHTTLVNTKIHFKDIAVGDHVTLLIKGTKTGNRDGVYMGRMFCVHSRNVAIAGTSSYYSPISNLTSAVVDQYVFRDPTDNTVYSIKKPVVGAIVAKAVNNSTYLENLQTINDMISVNDEITGFPSDTCMVVAKASDAKDIEIVLEDKKLTIINDRFIETKKNYYHRAELLIASADNANWYVTANSYDYTANRHSNENKHAVLIKIDYDELTVNKKLHINHTVTKVSANASYYSRQPTVTVNVSEMIKQVNADAYKAKTVWLKHGELKARLSVMPNGPAGLVDHY